MRLYKMELFKLFQNKIVLSIGIRHKAEEYIIQQIHNYTGQLSWRKNKQNYRGTNVEFMNFVQRMSLT